MAKKSLLLIVPFTALPRSSGGRQRIWHTIRHCSQHFDLTVWSFVSNQNEALLEADWLEELGVKYQHFLLDTHSFVGSLRGQLPYWFTAWWNQNLIKKAKLVGTGDYDKIQIEGTQLLYLIKYLPEGVVKSYVAYDISFISFWRRLVEEKHYLKKILHLWRLLEVYIYEKFYISRYDAVVAVSTVDAAWLNKYFGAKNIQVIPNGVERINFLSPLPKSKTVRLGFIGGFDHPPNIEAVKFILEKILPKMDEAGIAYQLLLSGNQKQDLIKKLIQANKLQDSKIKVLGFVEELSDFYQQIDLLLAPIFAGSGTRVKILESLSFARPVVTTKIGAEGLKINSKLLNIMPKQNERNIQAWVKVITQVKSNQISSAERNKLRSEMSSLLWEKILKAV